MNPPTHILTIYPSKKTAMLFRASDGVCLGQHAENTVIFGEEPNKRRSHVFIDGPAARKFLRETVTAQDLQAQGIGGVPVVEERNAEHTILVPESSDALSLPGGVNYTSKH